MTTAPFALAQNRHAETQPAVIGYVFPNNKLLDVTGIDPFSMTRVNYAFANIEDGRMILASSHDQQNLALLVALRKKNPSLQIVLSVGGWSWSGHFSDMALTTESRGLFIESVVSLVIQHDLEGLDIDWEYPGSVGAGNTFRPIDKTNFTLLLKELRMRFDREEKRGHRHWLISIAAGASNEFLDHTEMSEAQLYLDSVNLMSYDYYVSGGDKIAGHHAPLYTNPADPKKVSADASVRAFEAAGVPASKLVLGVPFYGHAWQKVSDTGKGLYQAGEAIPDSYLPYNAIVPKLASGDFERIWDSVATVPYLYDAQHQIFLSYDDPQSIDAKCEYVLEKKLGGVMFWDYAGDSDHELLNAIDKRLSTRNAHTRPTP